MSIKIKLMALLSVTMIFTILVTANTSNKKDILKKNDLRSDIEVVIKAKNFKQVITSIPLNVGGFAKEKTRLKIKTQIPGLIVKTLVKRGDKVAKGQVVCKLENKVLKAQVASCLARQKEALLNLRNIEKLFKDNHQSKIQLYAARSKLSLIMAELAKKQDDFDNTKIRSHLTGFVIDELPIAGSTVNVGEKITTIISDSTPEINFYISEKNISKLAIGNSVTVHRLGKIFKGEITYIAPSADNNTRTFLCVAHITSENTTLKANTTVNLTVNTITKKLHILPNNCLTLNSDGKTVVVVLTPDNKEEKSFKTAKASVIKVNVIKQTKDFIYVEGLPKNCLIVTLGNNFIKNKMIVKYIETS